MITNAHILFGYEKLHLNDDELQQFYDCNIPKENRFYKNLFHIYDSYVESIFFIMIPFSIMFLCSSLIILQMFETRKSIRYDRRGKFYYYVCHTDETCQRTSKKSKQTKFRDHDRQLCYMLIGTTFAFLILCLPTEINDIFNYIGRQRSCYDWLRKIILVLLQQIYYAGHFCIYTLTGPLFRKEFYSLFVDFRRRQTTITDKNRFSLVKIFNRSDTKYVECQNRANPMKNIEDAKQSNTIVNFNNITLDRPRGTISRISQI